MGIAIKNKLQELFNFDITEYFINDTINLPGCDSIFVSASNFILRNNGDEYIDNLYFQAFNKTYKIYYDIKEAIGYARKYYLENTRVSRVENY